MADETERGIYLISAYARFKIALDKRQHPDQPSDDPEIERHIWEAVEDAFRAHSRYRDDDPSVPFPHEISLFVADALSELLAGGDPASWRAFRHHPGPPKAAAQEGGTKRMAVCYIKACKIGIIKDKAHNKTVREAFGVANTTVQEWCRDNRFNVDPMDVPDTSDQDRATFIRILMEHSGEVYQRSIRTRSQKAITIRGSKRKSQPTK